ncbi:GntR family transcriptional regulator [Cellulomonas sp. McL0617]|uniref:GntR family transcriptional regulator n=1 Tax=Cellulomonas sp. McL0617 TaxID=3415675 RepID=UPI003CF7B749
MVIDKWVGGTEDRASPIAFALDPGSGIPTYLQLVQQVEQSLRLGYLKAGDQLPKVREVVADLAINPNTVLKAYRDLEGKGLTTGRPGQGTFIRADIRRVDLAGLTGLRASLTSWFADATESGLDQDGIVALFSSALRDFAERRGAVDTGDRDARRAEGGAA